MQYVANGIGMEYVCIVYGVCMDMYGKASAGLRVGCSLILVQMWDIGVYMTWMDCVWNMYGMRIEHAWNGCGRFLEYVWNCIGIGVEYVWNMYGIVMEYVWNM